MAAGDIVTHQLVNQSKSNEKRERWLRLLAASIISTNIIIGYALLGGLIFMKLEDPTKIETKEINVETSIYQDILWNFTMEMNVLYKSAWEKKSEQVFDLFKQDIITAIKESGLADPDGSSDIQWTFAESFLYAMSTITTVGYGNMAPKTAEGRVVTMIYASIGIPLTLLCLTNMGRFLGLCFRFLYGRICCALCRARKRRQSAVTNKKIIDSKKSNDAVAFSKGDNPEGGIQDTESGENAEICLVKTTPAVDQPTVERIRVPVLLVMAVIVCYILFGTAIFSLWEQKWDFLHGAYFSCVTITTIGFGDLVPGATSELSVRQAKQVVCSLYLLFGMSLLAMSIDLIQERVRSICCKIGTRLGIVRGKQRGNKK